MNTYFCAQEIYLCALEAPNVDTLVRFENSNRVFQKHQCVCVCAHRHQKISGARTDEHIFLCARNIFCALEAPNVEALVRFENFDHALQQHLCVCVLVCARTASCYFEDGLNSIDTFLEVLARWAETSLVQAIERVAQHVLLFF